MFACAKLGALFVTVTLNDPVVVSPLPSIAKQFTVVVPIGNKPPG
jgi:hypothetical protein